jgi:bifunctional NMN adenylyltransferase/nudix hydrolase
MSNQHEYEYIVYLGRFQPPHIAHIKAIEQGLEQADKIIIVIGSSDSSRSLRNPWNVAEREIMIRENFSAEVNERIIIEKVRDYYYNDKAWMEELTNLIVNVTEDSPRIAMLVHHKDASQKYLNDLDWDKVHIHNNINVDATQVRDGIFHWDFVSSKCEPFDGKWHDRRPYWDSYLTKPTLEVILSFKESPLFKSLVEEYEYIEEYREKWNKAPFPVTFNTVDALVIKSNHVLLVKRKFIPGKDLWALPGGFLRPDETLKDAMLRELKEETRIQVAKPVLERHIIGSSVFDHPDRDPRGRVITQCFFIDLGEGPLPKVKGSDDAKKSWWMPFSTVLQNPNVFYGDHGQIITQFLLEYRWQPHIYKNKANDELLARLRNEL